MADVNGGERPKFLTSLLDEAEQFDPSLFPPPNELDDGDTEMGICSLYLQKMFSLARFYKREAERTKLEHDYDSNHDDSACDENHAKYVQCREKHDVLMEIFWASCRADFDAWGVGSIGVRRGWKVVKTTEEGGISLTKFLGLLRPPG